MYRESGGHMLSVGHVTLIQHNHCSNIMNNHEKSQCRVLGSFQVSYYSLATVKCIVCIKD